MTNLVISGCRQSHKDGEFLYLETAGLDSDGKRTNAIKNGRTLVHEKADSISLLQAAGSKVCLVLW